MKPIVEARFASLPQNAFRRPGRTAYPSPYPKLEPHSATAAYPLATILRLEPHALQPP